MKLKRIFVAAFVALTLSVVSVNTVFAVDVISDDSYEWTQEDDVWSCTDKDGDPVNGWAVRIDEDANEDDEPIIYYLDKKGVMKTGWVKDDGNWYYLDDETGELVTDDWVDNYYVNSDGEMTKIR